MINSGVDGIEELDAQVLPALFVPSAGADSLPTQFRFGAPANILPGNAGSFSRDNPASTPLNFRGPSRLDFRRILRCGIVQAGEELRGEVSTLLHRQCHRFTEKFLRQWGHDAILHLTTAAQHALEPTARQGEIQRAPRLSAAR